MKFVKLEMLTLVGIFLFILVVSGCSSNVISLSEKGLVSVEKQDSEQVKILWTDVYQRDGQTWAYGVLEQRSSGPGSIKTHVDIQVLDLDSSVRYETISEDVCVPRNSAGRGIDWRRFKVRLPEILPENSQIRMTVHSGSHKRIGGNW